MQGVFDSRFEGVDFEVFGARQTLQKHRAGRLVLAPEGDRFPQRAEN